VILLEEGNSILQETCGAHINLPDDEKREPLDVRLCDFDDVSYRIQVEKDNMNKMKVSINMPCYHQIQAKGGSDAVKKYFGDYSCTAETGFDVTICIDFTAIKEDKEKLCVKIGQMKLLILGGVFDHFFAALNSGTPIKEPFQFDIRSDTRVYFFPRDDRVTVIFSIDFVEKFDKLIAKVFLNEFVLARKNNRDLGSSPSCNFSENPPTELAALGVKEANGVLGFMAFQILASHVKDGSREKGVKVLQTFRTFLQYHIKMAKSNFHSRMRARVISLIKVLNRAKVDGDSKDEKKTASGRTFKRA
jgi:actin related protein 2/3 complex subunit 2